MAEWLGAGAVALLDQLETYQYGLLALIIGLEAAGVPWPVAAEFVLVVMGYQVFRAEANPARSASSWPRGRWAPSCSIGPGGCWDARC